MRRDLKRRMEDEDLDALGLTQTTRSYLRNPEGFRSSLFAPNVSCGVETYALVRKIILRRVCPELVEGLRMNFPFSLYFRGRFYRDFWISSNASLALCTLSFIGNSFTTFWKASAAFFLFPKRS